MRLNQVTKMKVTALREYLTTLVTELQKEEDGSNDRSNNLFDSKSFEETLNVRRVSLDEVKDMDVSELKETLSSYISSLDELDGEDFFGTQGWRYYFMGED